MDEDSRAPQAWIDAIAQGEADAAAGRVVSSETILRGLRESIQRMEAARGIAVAKS